MTRTPEQEFQRLIQRLQEAKAAYEASGNYGPAEQGQLLAIYDRRYVACFKAGERIYGYNQEARNTINRLMGE